MSAKDNEIGECEEYLPIQEWKEENRQYMVGAYLYQKFQDEIQEIQELEQEGVIVYDPAQKWVYTVPKNVEMVAKTLIPLEGELE